MSYEMEVNFTGQYVEAYSKGQKNVQTAKELWHEIIRLCSEHHCYRVLGIAESTQQMSLMDSLGHEDLFRGLGITPRYKIAWVELNESEFSKLQILETILLNRGARGKAFKKVEEAKAWLLDDSPSSR